MNQISLEGYTFSNRGHSLWILMCQRIICLEGSTFSNRGHSLRILITNAIGCLEGSTLQMVYCLPGRCSFNPSNPETPSLVTKSIGFQPKKSIKPNAAKECLTSSWRESVHVKECLTSSWRESVHVSEGFSRHNLPLNSHFPTTE